MVSVEGRTDRAILITRDLFRRITDDPAALVQMTAREVKPEYIEDTISGILEYMAMTQPDELKEEED